MKRFVYFSALVFALLPGRAAFADDMKVPAPQFSLASGIFTSAQTVKVTGSTPNAVLYCTINGDKPTKSSLKCPEQIVVAETLTLKAVAVTSAGTASEVVSATYTIHDQRWSVLRKLDAAAAKFTSTSADFEFDSVVTDPAPDKDVQNGTAYYERTGTAFKMAAHIDKLNGKPAPKMYTYEKGVLKLYDGLTNQQRSFSKASKFESYLMLGFGASGTALEDKWTITYLGPDTVDGVKTEKLELVAKDADVKKNIPKVTIWVDTTRAVSLKQIFDEGPGQYRVCVYFNIKVNQALPTDAFTLKTNAKTEFINQ